MATSLDNLELDQQMSDVDEDEKSITLSIKNNELLLATNRGDRIKVEQLLNEGADINYRNNHGNTVLHLAVKKADLEMLKLLLSQKPKLCPNHQNLYPLDFAKRAANADMVNLLTEFSKQNSLPLQSEEANHLEKKFQTTEKDSRGLSVHGNIYQFMILFLFLYRGLCQEYSFYLGTEIKEAQKFDDLVFMYITAEKQKKYRLLQAKHRFNELEKITAADLLSDGAGDFCIRKYLMSYLAAKKNAMFIDGEIVDVTLCTNIDFDYDSLAAKNIDIEEILQLDNILDMPSLEKKPKRYRFKDNVAELLEPKSKLAKRLVECMMKNICMRSHQKDDIFFDFHVLLATEVIDVNSKTFHQKFIDNIELSDGAQSFRLALMGEIKEKYQGRLLLQNINEALTSYKQTSQKGVGNKNAPSTTPNEALPITLNLSKNFGKETDVKGTDVQKREQKWPKSVTLKEIKDFLQHFVFAVNQPNQKKLGEIIMDEMGNEFGLIACQNVYNMVFVTIMNWFVGNKGERFFSHAEGRKLLEEARQGVFVAFKVKKPTESFTGRKMLLDELHTLSKDVVGVVVGLGGVGKSETISKFIELYGQDYGNNIIWLNAESSSTLTNSFRELASDVLRINTKNANGAEKNIFNIVDQVYKVFSRVKSLFIFDNAVKYRTLPDDDVKNGIAGFLPFGVKGPSVLVTSRNRNWPPEFKVFQLNAFEENEAIDFIKSSLKIEDDSSDYDSQRLATKLQGFPLALQLAVAHIRTENRTAQNVGISFTIANFIEKFDNEKCNVLRLRFPEDSANLYSESIFTTWNVTLAAIELNEENGKEALDIFNVMSYLAAEDIPSMMLSSLVVTQHKLASVIELLKQFSMISLVRPGFFNIHRLVQEVTKIKLLDQVKEEHVLRRAVGIFDKNGVNSTSVVHAISAWSYASNYKLLLNDFARVSTTIAVQLLKSGSTKDAYFFELTILKLLKGLSPGNVSVARILLTTQNTIASILAVQGKTTLAMKSYTELLKFQKMFLQTDDSTIITTMQAIAKLLVKEFDYKAALGCLQNILKMQTEKLEISSTRCSIARVYVNQGKYNDALLILENERNNFRENIVDFLKITDDIAQIHLRQCLYDDLVSIVREWKRDFYPEYSFYSNDFMRRHQFTRNVDQQIAHSNVYLGLGENNLEILPQFLGLARIEADAFLSAGRIVKSQEMAEKVLSHALSILGENHVEVWLTRRLLAEILRYQGKLAEALELCEQVLSHLETELGVDHLETINTKHISAKILSDQCKCNEALKVYSDVLSKRKKIQGNSHPDTLKTINSIAEIHTENDEFEKALDLYHGVLKTQGLVLGLMHNDTLSTISNIGMLLCHEKLYEDALKLLQIVYSKRKQILPLDSPETLAALNNIGLILSRQGELSEALERFNKLLDRQKTALDKGHLSITETESNKGSVLLQLGKYEEAEELLTEVFDEFKKVLGRDHPKTLGAVGQLQLAMRKTQGVCESSPGTDATSSTGNNSRTSFSAGVSKLLDLVKDILKDAPNRNDRTFFYFHANRFEAELLKNYR